MSIGKVFIYINTALIAGIASWSFLYDKTSIWIIVGGIAFFSITVVMFFTTQRFVIFLLALSLSFGTVLADVTIERAYSQNVHFIQASENTLSGVVQDTRDSSLAGRSLFVRVPEVGIVRLYTYDRTVSKGDEITFTCDVVAEDFFLNQYVSGGVIGSCTRSTINTVVIEQTKKNFFVRTKEKLTQKIEQSLPSPSAELLEGILLGEQKALPQRLAESLRMTGTIHIAVLSGFNITVVAFVLLRFLFSIGIGIRRGVWIALSGVALLIGITGLTAPAVRAGIMVAVVLLARYLGRGQSAFSALIFSATIMLVFDPLLLGWSLSFQLSFVATIGVLFSERLSPRFDFLPNMFAIRENVRTTFAATFMTMPILAFSFSGISIIALFANAVILPFVPITMACGVLVISIGFLSESVGQLSGYPSYIFLSFISKTVEQLGNFPFAYIESSLAATGVVIWYAVSVVLLRLHRRHDERRDETTSKYVPFIGAAVLTSIFLFSFLGNSGAPVTVSVYDVGQGDAIHIRTREGFDVLIDGGPDASILSYLGEHMPYFDRTIELVVVTHPHADHITGLLSVLQKYSVAEVWMTDVTYDSPLYSDILQRITNPIYVSSGTTKHTPTSIGTLSFSVLSADASYAKKDINNSSVVLRAEIEKISMLFMGDAGEAIEKTLVAENIQLDADILKVGHQGASDASSQSFIETVRPEVAIISVGEQNQYGHPHEQTIETLDSVGAKTFQTKDCGSVSIAIHTPEEYTISSLCTP